MTSPAIITRIEQCIVLLQTDGENTKLAVKNALQDLVNDLNSKETTESGLPF